MNAKGGDVLIEVRGADFGYRSRPVVRNVDVCVRAGDFVGIVGPNGGGKTTLFRGMLGLISPLAGSVVRNVADVGFVPQRETLDPVYPLTVREVVEMGAYGRARGIRRVSRDDRAKAGDLLESVELGPRAGELFASLSGGQRQRVLIARALMTDPRVLLLDEPTSGVDRRAENLVMSLLARLNGEGLAVLLVSHNLQMVRDAVDDVLLVGDGEVRSGAPDELLSDLDRLFTSSAAGGE